MNHFKFVFALWIKHTHIISILSAIIRDVAIHSI